MLGLGPRSGCPAVDCGFRPIESGFMTHSVRSHLRVDIDAYDETIRRFIPGYGAMLEAAARAVTDMSPGLVLDLGAGTGALAAAILADGRARLVKEVAELEAKAVADLAAARGRTGEELRGEIVRLSSAAISSAVAASLNDRAQQELIESFIKSVGASK